jgi:EAL domain-containing protein (putative c-di-GMP-specific phosphodiesterase class I)
LLYYEPKADLANGTVRSVEALLRWKHPRRGLAGPDESIPLAQQTALIKPLTLDVLDEALSQCRRLTARRHDPRRGRHLSVRNLAYLSQLPVG